MRLAIIGSRGFPSTYGGYETLVRFLAPHLVACGHEVTVYCRERGPDGARRWMDQGVECVTTRGVDSKSLSTLTFGATACLHAAWRRYDAALVLNIANGYWLPFLRVARVPFAVNTDGVEWKRAKWSKLGRAIFLGGAKLCAWLAPQLVCDSRALGELWREEFGRDSVFIPYGGEIRGELSDQPVRELGLIPGTYVLSVARLAPENNVELTLDAIDLLGADAPKAVVVGSANFDNPITDRLERMQDEGRVLWLGHVADQDLLAALWQHAGVYVHGHSVGGTNPALLQALGAGAPTIALDTVFNREVLGEGPWLYPLGEPEVLATGLAELTRRDASPRPHAVALATGDLAAEYRWPFVLQRYRSMLVHLQSGGRG